MIQPTEIIEESTNESRSNGRMKPKRRTMRLNFVVPAPVQACVDEWTGQKVLKDQQIPDDLSLDHVRLSAATH